jgi:DNA-binding NtrC family response regulator
MPSAALILHRTEDFPELVQRILAPLDLSIQPSPIQAPMDRVVPGNDPDLVVVEFGSGERTTIAALESVRACAPGCAILAVTDSAGASTAVEVMGAVIDDYVLAPPVPGDLLARCRRVLASRDLHRRLDLLQAELNRRYGAHRIVCRSSAMEAVYSRVLQLAPTRTTVLIVGESGAGKELIARSLHYNSNRRDHPFVAMNCAALTETLIESELFGHQRGAFTGAVDTVPGKYELANGGTLFLDEVGSMGAPVQVKLLRVLEEGEYMRVGGTRTLRADVRVIAATNSDLDEQVRRGEFRRDLLYRLKVATIEVPPLRLRTDDIPVLARTFIRQSCEENGLPVKDLAPETVKALGAHAWPGNVRELKNLLESLVVTVPDAVLLPEHLPPSVCAPRQDSPPGTGRKGLTLAEVERLHVEQTLHACGGNRTRAARQLGIGIRTLQRKIRDYGLDVPAPNGMAAAPASTPRGAG